jgi:hypothetical protein
MFKSVLVVGGYIAEIQASARANPTKAITMGHFPTEEILAQVKAALVGVEV